MPRSWFVAALLVLAPNASALAQSESQDVQVRNRCRQFAQYIEVGPKHPHYEEALAGIDGCGETGGAVLAETWSDLTATDSLAAGQLAWVSSRFRDRNLLDGLLQQIADESRARPVRIAMLGVLVSYYAAGRTLPTGVTEEGINPDYCTLGAWTHFDAREGAAPVTDADRPRILSTIRSLGAGDSDTYVRSAAACTAAALALVGGPG